MVLSYDKDKLKSLIAKSKLLGIEIKAELLSKLYNNIIEFKYSEDGLLQVYRVNEDITSIELPDVPLSPYDTFEYDALAFPHKTALNSFSSGKIVTTVKLPKSLDYIEMRSLWISKIKRLWLYDTTEIIGDVYSTSLEMIVILSSKGGKPKVIKI